MKKQIRAIFVIFLVFIMLFGLGCTSRGKITTKKTVDEDYHTGTRGLEMDFVKNAPPYKIYDRDNLEVTVELKNKGAYPDSNSFVGKLEISGFDAAAIKGSWDGGNTITPSLQGKTQYNPEGGYDTMTYKDSDGVDVPFDYDSYKTDIIVTSCYKYKTIASPTVCIDPEPYKIVQEKKVCQIRDQGLGSQGAPVAVDRIEQEVSSDKIYFRIFIKNSGRGTVILPDKYNECPFDLDHQDIDKVIVSAKLSHDSSPVCNPQGTVNDPVRLVNSRGVIFCSFNKPIAVQSAYLAPLHIEASYVYSESISKRLEIVNLK